MNKPGRNYLNYTEEQVRQAADAVKKISGPQRSAAQTSIQFVLANPAITSAIVGIRTLDQLKDAVMTLSAPQLTSDEKELFSKSIAVNQYTDHR